MQRQSTALIAFEEAYRNGQTTPKDLAIRVDYMTTPGGPKSVTDFVAAALHDANATDAYISAFVKERTNWAKRKHEMKRSAAARMNKIPEQAAAKESILQSFSSRGVKMSALSVQEIDAETCDRNYYAFPQKFFDKAIQSYLIDMNRITDAVLFKQLRDSRSKYT